MKKKFLGFGIFILGLIACATTAEATSDYVYIPDNIIRSQLTYPFYAGEDFIEIENSLPTKEQLALDNREKNISIYSENIGLAVTSLEGLQYGSNIKGVNLSGGVDIVDTRPLSKLTELTDLFSYSYNSYEKEQKQTDFTSYDGRHSYFDLNTIANLPKLRNITLNNAVTLDYTPLETLPELVRVSMSSGTDFPYLVDDITVPLSKETKTIKFPNPIKLPNFAENTVEYWAKFVSEDATKGDLNEIGDIYSFKIDDISEEGVFNINNVTESDHSKTYLLIMMSSVAADASQQVRDYELSNSILIPVYWY